MAASNTGNTVNRVKILIAGKEYFISTTEEPAYVQELASGIGRQLEALCRRNPSLSAQDALLLCCLGYADETFKAQKSADHLRTQLSEYLGDAARARIEADEARREIERLNRQLNLKNKE